MANQLSDAAYAEQIGALMPRGRAWPTSPRSVMGRLRQALAPTFARLDRVGTGFLREILPSHAIAFLPDWERVVGLPDECSPLAPDLEGRRAALVTKLVSQPDLSAESYRRIGRTFGVEIAVVQQDQAAAEMIPDLDTGNGRWRFVWWIQIPTSGDFRRFRTTSRIDRRLVEFERVTELECRLQKASPAHTLLIVGYTEAT